MSRDTPAAPRRFRPLIVLLFGALALVLIWLVGSHWLLNSQWLPQRLSTIEGVEVRWTNAQSLHPGRWEVDNLYLAQEDEALPITVEASQATLSLSLLALLRGELHIQALEANGIRRFTIGDIALEAEGQLKVEDTQFSQETLSVPYVGLDITQGRLVRLSDQTTLVQDIQLRSTASLDSLSTQQSNDALTEALLDALTAQLAITAQADAWDVFMPYLEALPWLSLAGSGVLEGELALAEGQLQPDSELTLAAPELALSMDEQRLRSTDNTRRWLVADDTPPPHTATGQGRVRLAVEEGQLRFTTQLENVTLADTHPYATNTQLALATHIPNQRLDQLDLPTRASFELSGEVTRLDMLDRYLATAFDGQGVRLSGQGSITASATLQDARPYEASLTVQAPTLGAELLELTAQGSGTLDAALSTKEQITAKLAFTDATLRHQERTLLANAALTLAAQSPLDPEQAQQSATAQLSWEDATLPNIQTLQPYLASVLPSPSPLTLNSGTATSHGQLILTTEQLSGELHLAGNALTTGWQRSGQRGTLVSNTQLTLAIRQAALDGTEMDISGSRLSWQVADPQRPGEALESTLVLRDGRFQRQNATPSGQFTLEGSVQRLGFLNTFLPDAHGVSLSGNGQLFLQGAFIDDTLQAPTRLRVNANQLEVTFLDYLATGRGELTAQLDSPEQAQLSLGIPQFALRRQDDDRPHLEGRHFALTTQTDRFSDVLDSPAPEHFTTRVALPITEVPDIARYNRYLAEDAGVELLSGSASLTSEWLLEGRRAQGDITLRAFDTEMALMEQRLRGDVTLHLQLTEGDIETRRFVANDSYLRLENVFRRSDDGTQ
ncbi:MAG: hypothetical protein VYB92_10375, partial [Pseudomonadota bacterium]|nr:hypothetical protein [Pseudomonadota bacterium]